MFNKQFEYLFDFPLAINAYWLIMQSAVIGYPRLSHSNSITPKSDDLFFPMSDSQLNAFMDGNTLRCSYDRRKIKL